MLLILLTMYRETVINNKELLLVLVRRFERDFPRTYLMRITVTGSGTKTFSSLYKDAIWKPVTDSKMTIFEFRI